jgi:demethylmenaquinone methyltransferase/2-methoxy-6-polyprenyl-1,4-benzoquinol methylase
MPTDSRFTPHRVLAPHYASAEAKQPFLRKLFDDSAAHYERVASWGFLGTGNWYRREALRRAGLKASLRVADIAAGTGITARAAAAIVGRADLVTCVEPSSAMLQESAKRLGAVHIQGAADALPLPNDEVDFLVMGFALRHVENLETAFSEFHRVLKPGGKLLIMDITKPESPLGNRLVRFYFRDFMPRFAHLVTGSHQARYLMEYYWETLTNMIPPASVLEALAQSGFMAPDRHVELGMFSEYRAKKP